MKISEYFRQSFAHIAKGLLMLVRGIWATLKMLFTRHSNVTWIVIFICLSVYSFCQIAESRAERNRASHEAAVLQEKLDSITGKNVRYTIYKE